MSKPIDHSDDDQPVQSDKDNDQPVQSDKDDDQPVQSDKDVVSLLMKMQRQLLYLEKKIDILIKQSQEKPHRGNPSSERPYRGNSSSEKPYRKKSYIKPLRSSGHSRRHGSEEKRDSTGEKNSDQAFYSKFRKRDENRGAGPRKKPSYRKPKTRE